MRHVFLALILFVLSNAAVAVGSIQGQIVDENQQALVLKGAGVAYQAVWDNKWTLVAAEPAFGSGVLPDETYSVRFGAPHGFSVSVSVCRNCTSHPPSSFVPGDEVLVDLKDSLYFDIHFKLVPDVSIATRVLDDGCLAIRVAHCMARTFQVRKQGMASCGITGNTVELKMTWPMTNDERCVLRTFQDPTVRGNALQYCESSAKYFHEPGNGCYVPALTENQWKQLMDQFVQTLSGSLTNAFPKPAQ